MSFLTMLLMAIGTAFMFMPLSAQFVWDVQVTEIYFLGTIMFALPLYAFAIYIKIQEMEQHFQITVGKTQ